MNARFMDIDVDTSYPFFGLFHSRICPLFFSSIVSLALTFFYFSVFVQDLYTIVGLWDKFANKDTENIFLPSSTT